MSEKIISETPINCFMLKEEIQKIKKRDSELNFRATKTEEYLNQIGPSEMSNEIFDKIMKLNIPRLKDQYAHKIVDIMPKTVKDLKVVLQGYTFTINNDNAKKIVDILNKRD